MIEIEINDTQVMEVFNRLLAASQDFSEPMADIARMLRNTSEDAFQNQADPWGNPWKPLSAGTIAKRRGDGDVLSILQDTGGLAGSVTSDSGLDWAEVGAAKEYAAIHQFGGQAGRGRKTTIPARPYLPLNESGELPPNLSSDILEVLQDYLVDVLRGT